MQFGLKDYLRNGVLSTSVKGGIVYTIPGNQLPELSKIDHSCTRV
jgi:hypothetical protein